MLISEEYRALQAKLHVDRDDYGMASVQYAPIVAQIMQHNNIRSVLDYGAGKGRLGQELRKLLPWQTKITEYDPAIPGKEKLPDGRWPLVACIDVLEHIEPSCLEEVLESIRIRTAMFAVLTVHSGPAQKVLEDGRNAHLIQEGPRWWLPKLLTHFDLMDFQRNASGFLVAMSKA